MNQSLQGLDYISTQDWTDEEIELAFPFALYLRGR